MESTTAMEPATTPATTYAASAETMGSDTAAAPEPARRASANTVRVPHEGR